MGECSFLDGRVALHAGDCLDVLDSLPDASVDSVVTDPPYHLTSIVKRFGADNAAPARVKQTGAFARASRGFMGKQWDGGDIAFQPELWAKVLRVLKPGGHVVAFSGTRTYHRMACAIEDAGFEIRDQLGWAYGSGFPKSHDVSKGIDKRPGVGQHAEFAKHLKTSRLSQGFTNSFDVSERVTGRRTGACANWEKYQFPEAKWWPSLRDLLGLDDCWGAIIAEADRAKISEADGTRLAVAPGQGSDRGAVIRDITAPATDAARQWQGWGTALKPAWEPICLARKPLIGTVAANVLAHGVGALNIDGCRVGTADELRAGKGELWSHRRDGEASAERRYQDRGSTNFAATPGPRGGDPAGRWPANLIHDGSDEVLACFPDAPGQQRQSRDDQRSQGSVYGAIALNGGKVHEPRGDSGSAARFFYTAKADADDRLGSKHPTVKPVDLMQWLVRLVTPKGGVVLDPFAGTGTTGAAAFYEGCSAVLIEREAEYQSDIARRMELVLAGPDERAHAIAKASGAAVNHGPLFMGSAA